MKNADALKRRLTHERQTAKQQIEGGLTFLQQRIKAALDSVREGGAVDTNLIVNAAQLTEYLVRWNTVRDLLPYADDEE